MRNRVSGFFERYMNGTKGVISLFLAILMVPFASVAAMLVNAGRINSAVAVFDEALCNASNSVLGTYDPFIRTRFGLMAISQNTADGGTALGNTSSGYDGDAFIKDLFSYYMERNLGVLSNTYKTSNVDAEGLYPLSDPEVLLSAVEQTGKITLPVKLAADWGSLDELINKISKPFKVFEKIENFVSGAADTVTNIDKMFEKKDEMDECYKKCLEAKEKYENAYNTFNDAVSEFNQLIDDINYWTALVNQYQSEVDREKQKIGNLSAQLDQKKQELNEKEEKIKQLNEKKTQGYLTAVVELAKEVKTLKTEIDDLEDEIAEISPGYKTAIENLESAQNTLQSYKNAFPDKKSKVESAKNDYYNKIVALRDLVNSTGNSVKEFQSSVTTMITTLISAAETGVELNVEITNKQIDEAQEYFRYQKTLADYLPEDDKAVEESQKYADRLSKLSTQKTDEKNKAKIAAAAKSTANDTYKEAQEFAETDYAQQFKTIYDNLEKVRLNVNDTVIPTSYSKISYRETVYVEVDIPDTPTAADAAISGIENRIENSSVWTVIKVLLEFVDAMTNVNWVFSALELNAEIDMKSYDNVGGLPSQKNQKGAYPLYAPHDAEDAAQALSNKRLLNSFSDINVYSVDKPKTDLQVIIDSINELRNCVSPFRLRNIGKIKEAAGDLIGALGRVASSIGSAIMEMVVDRLYIATYCAYNTANRTTYEKKALTGASYSLPKNSELGKGYTFCGAETEYIFTGNMNETDNQKSVAWKMLGARCIANFMNVLDDPVFSALANALGAFLPFLGQLIVYVIAVFVESYLDMTLLCGGSTIPIVKTYIFLSPYGLMEYLKKAVNLDLRSGDKEKIYNKVRDCGNKINEKSLYKSLEGKFFEYNGDDPVVLPTYDEYNKTADENKKSTASIFELDYTKQLWLLMVLFGDKDEMTTRLADIIQMESTYNAKGGTEIATYDFNLDKSYTYLRTSGDFSSQAFIAVGDTNTLTSQKRVIYNGY